MSRSQRIKMKSRKKYHQHSARSTRIESLEDRNLLAADFIAMDSMPVDPVDPPIGIVVAEGTEEADRIGAFVDGDNMLHVVVNGDENLYNSDQIDGILVRAKGGDDRIWIAPSVSQWTRIHGGAGNDRIQGGSGNDDIQGGAGNDRMGGGFGNDLIVGDAGDDVISGGFGHDALLGSEGNDILRGGFGDDAIAGGSGNDRIGGGWGNDWIFGDATNDVPDDYRGLVDYALKHTNENHGHDTIAGVCTQPSYWVPCPFPPR